VTDEGTRVVVMGATPDTPPPGIGVVAEAVELVFADTEEPVWPRAGDVRWIQAASAGVDGLLFPDLVESDVVLTNARGIFDDAIAEYVLGLLLMLAKGMPGVVDRQRRSEWKHRDTEPLSGKRVLVVGVGPIGRAIGRVCADLGMAVRGVGTTARRGDDVFRVVFGADELLDAAAWADYVVDVLPATAQTRRLFGAEVFAVMRPAARFLNVGRGSTVDEQALVHALEDGRIAGAALDVFEEEPLLEDSPLWGMPNVIVSPHMAGDFAGWREALVELFVDNLRRYVTGRPLKNVVDKERGYVPS
jgi:phosphoglycerate dehydrogenase-like enzyme